MTVVPIHASCRAVWPVLLQALGLLARRQPRLVGVTALAVAAFLRSVDDRPETIALRATLFTRGMRLAPRLAPTRRATTRARPTPRRRTR